MVIQIQIKPELIEWVSNQTGMDRDEAEEFTKHFVGMLYLTGALEAVWRTSANSANAGAGAEGD